MSTEPTVFTELRRVRITLDNGAKVAVLQGENVDDLEVFVAVEHLAALTPGRVINDISGQRFVIKTVEVLDVDGKTIYIGPVEDKHGER